MTAFKEKNTAVSQQKKSASATKESNKTENQKNSQDESSKQNVLTEAAASEETVSGDTLAKADFLAQQYNYDKAIDLLKNDPDYGSSQKMQNAVKKYEETKATCTAWPLEEVTHVFYHILIKDTSKAFDGDYKEADYNQVMTTIDEFNKITQTMYEKGYVMVSIKDMAKVDENGNITEGEILLPPGKTPFVLSQDDVCYYHYMDGDGFATKLVLDEEGKIRNEYVEDDGSISVGDYFPTGEPGESWHLPGIMEFWDTAQTKVMKHVPQIWMQIKYSGWRNIRISVWRKNGQPQKKLPMP